MERGETPGNVKWSPSFKQALDIPHWHEPLAMSGGLFSQDELGGLIEQLEHKPVLTGMLLGSSRPNSPGEQHFIENTEERAKAGIWRSVVVTQMALLGMTAMAVAIALGAWWVKENNAFYSLLYALDVNPFAGLPVFLYFIVVTVGIAVAIMLGSRVSDFVQTQHDDLLNICYSRWIEPWLLGLFYSNSDNAEQRLEKLLGEYSGRRFVDKSLQARLRAFTTRASPPY